MYLKPDDLVLHKLCKHNFTRIQKTVYAFIFVIKKARGEKKGYRS